MDGLLALPDMKSMMDMFTRLRDEETRYRCEFQFCLVVGCAHLGSISKHQLMLTFMSSLRFFPHAVAFVVFDANNDGVIDKAELLNVLQLTNKRGMTPQQLVQIVDSIMARWDPRGEGKLEYPAFKDMLSTTISNLSL